MRGPKFSENNGLADQFSRNFGPPDQNFRDRADNLAFKVVEHEIVNMVWTLPPPHPSPPLSPPPSLPSPSCLVFQLCHWVLHALSPCSHIILLCSTRLWKLIPEIGRRRDNEHPPVKMIDMVCICMYRFMLSVSMGCLAASLSNSAFKRGVYRRPQSTTVSYKRTSLLLWVYRYCYILNAVSPPFCLPR